MRLSSVLLNQLQRAFGDIHRDIADALEILDDLERRRNESQIARTAARARDFITQIVDLDLEPV